MNLNSRVVGKLVLTMLIVSSAGLVQADSVPELLHYKFNTNSGTSVPNLASAPPAGTETATLMGGLTQNGADLNGAGDGYSILGTGVASTTDFLNTGWATSLPGSFTISFKTQNTSPTTNTSYIFGDVNAGSFRCFTGGVAGSSNWILRGNSITDTFANGAATVAPHRTTFVYDLTLGNIKSYVDGVLNSTVAQLAALNISGAGPFKVGGYSGNNGLLGTGLLDDFRIYNRALSAQEVADLDVEADIQVSKTNFEAGLLPGRATTYTVQVLNGGWSPSGAVQIVDDVPDALTNSTWTCASTPDGLCPNASGGPDINELTGPLQPDEMLEYTVTATPSGSPSEFISNTVTATGAGAIDSVTANNTATDIDPVVTEGIFIDGFEDLGKALLRTPIGQHTK